MLYPHVLIVLSGLVICVVTSNMYTLSGARRRGSLARTIYNRMIEDEQHRNDQHAYWYEFDTSKLPEELCSMFLRSSQDNETEQFLENCYEKSDWVFYQIYHSFAKAVLSIFMETTSINGWLGRGSMFVYSSAQFSSLLDIQEDTIGENLLDLGAGDGEVTKHMAPFFSHVYATETSRPMITRLTDKGYSILAVDSWTDSGVKFDVISCLNLLDRCDRPVTILHDMKKVLKPGGLVVVAVVLPFNPYVEFGGNDNKPTELLNVQGETFEEQSASFIKDVFESAGYSLVRFTRLPYLCEGDMESSFYTLDDAVFVLRLTDHGGSG